MHFNRLQRIDLLGGGGGIYLLKSLRFLWIGMNDKLAFQKSLIF